MISTEESVIFLVPSDRLGGAERVIHMTAVDLLTKGYQVKILCISKGDLSLFRELSSSRCEVIYFSDSRERYGIIPLLGYFLGNRKNVYRLVFSSHVHCNALLALLRSLGVIRTRSLVCRESTLIGRRFRGGKRFYFWLCYLFYRSIDHVVCQTEEMKRVLPEFATFIPKESLLYLPNPVSTDQIDRGGVEISDSPLFVSVGRLIPEKGYVYLVRAFNEVLRKVPRAELKIFGEGYERSRLLGLISELGLQEKVSLCGFTAVPLDVMKSADVCVISSLVEGFPNTLLEMMKANLRVVSTTCAGGISEIPGLITCAPGDFLDLAESMLRAVEMPCIDQNKLFDEELFRRSPRNFVNAILRLSR